MVESLYESATNEKWHKCRYNKQEEKHDLYKLSKIEGMDN